MRKNQCVGILREARKNERRAPLTPADVKWLVERGIRVEIESSGKRVFTDAVYRKNGAVVVDSLKKARICLGIKPPRKEDLRREKIYMFFSHTRKGQKKSMPLLKECVRKKITLIDPEMVIDRFGMRLLYFGRFAGICGAVDSFHYLGKRLEAEGRENIFRGIKPAYEYDSLEALKKAVKKAGRQIRLKGFDKDMRPFIAAVTGHGNVSQGIQEAMDPLGPVEIHPQDLLEILKKKKYAKNRIYKVVFCREQGLRSRDGKGFYFEEYLKHPERFRSDLDRYLQHIAVLFHGSYWDSKYPRFVTKKMVHDLAGKRPFRLKFIGDISCDVGGSIQLTCRTTDSDNAVYTYDPVKKQYSDGITRRGINIMAVDNLPSELPAEASREYGRELRGYVYQIAVCGTRKITEKSVLPGEIRRGVMTQDGKLGKDFVYLKKYMGGV